MSRARKRYEPSPEDPTYKIAGLPANSGFDNILNSIRGGGYKGPIHLTMKPDVTVTLPSNCVRKLTEKHIHVGRSKITFFNVEGSLSRAAPTFSQRGLPMPIWDPAARARQDERGEHLCHHVRVTKIELGVVVGQGRDGFSVEWTTKKDVVAYMFFDDKERMIIVEIGDHSTVHKQRIIINMANIESISIASLDYQPFALFRLHAPPIFAIQQHFSDLAEWQQEMDTPPSWKRLRSFDAAHERVRRYASRSLRFVLANDHDHLKDFMDMSSFSKLPHLQESDLQESAQLNLYSDTTMSHLNRLIASEDLPYSIKFQLEALRYNKVLLPTEILAIAPRIRQLKQDRGALYTADALHNLSTYIKKSGIAEQSGVAAGAFDGALREHAEAVDGVVPQPTQFSCYHITFTPTSVALEGPMSDVGNRVLRMFPGHLDHFIRVHFTEEGGYQYRYDHSIDNETFIDREVGGILHNGFQLAGRHFEFFGYSTSALKEHSCWFLAPFYDTVEGEISAENLRWRLGDFNRNDLIHNPAKWAARIGQTLTATEPTVWVGSQEYEWAPDIPSPWGEKTPFTDGCGEISPLLAQEVWDAHQALHPIHKPVQEILIPKVFQIRFGPAKGVVAVNYKLKGRRIRLRHSMKKFGQLDPNERLRIEVALMWHSPSPMYLNQPLITLLETLGIQPAILHLLLDEALEATKEALHSSQGISNLMSTYHLGRSFHIPHLLSLLDKYGLQTLWKDDQMLQKARNFALYHVERDLKYKTNIPVPDAYTLVGVADVHEVLQEGEIYVCIQEPGKPRIFLEGSYLITRSPMIHTGDIQLVHAIGKPLPNTPYHIEPLPNSIVFPCKGERPLPNCLGGGDLDGDMYNIINVARVPELLPEHFDQSASYAPPEPLETEYPAEIGDVADFFTRFMTADSIGLISVRHRLIADQERDGARSKQCLTLSEQHSVAVDTPKTGRPVPYHKIVRQPKLTPDWHAGENFDSTNGDYYQSQRALGILYRAVNLTKTEQLCQSIPPPPLVPTSNTIQITLNSKIVAQLQGLPSTHPQLLDNQQLQHLFNYYRSQLAYIQVTHTLSNDPLNTLSEAEVFLGSIAGKTSQPRKRKELTTRMRSLSTDLVQAVRNRLVLKEEGHLADQISLKNAWNAWELVQEQETREVNGAATFGWTALRSVLEMLQRLEKADSESD